MPRLYRSILLARLKFEFPELRATLNDQDGNIYMEMSAWADFTVRAMKDGSKDTVRMSFLIAHEFYKGGNRKLQNAIAVSFLEDLYFGRERWAWELLSRELKAVLDALIEAGLAEPLRFDRSGYWHDWNQSGGDSRY